MLSHSDWLSSLTSPICSYTLTGAIYAPTTIIWSFPVQMLHHARSYDRSRCNICTNLQLSIVSFAEENYERPILSARVAACRTTAHTPLRWRGAGCPRA